MSHVLQISTELSTFHSFHHLTLDRHDYSSPLNEANMSCKCFLVLLKLNKSGIYFCLRVDELKLLWRRSCSFKGVMLYWCVCIYCTAL